MATKPGRSEWRDDDRWKERVAADAAFLRGQLSAEQVTALDEVVAKLDDDEIGLAFVIVFGSQARGEADKDSDIDIYAEAKIPKARGFSIQGLDFLINPNGTLIGGANLGFEMNEKVISDARVWHDKGAFRDLLIRRDEQES
jgi:hypothetical protein